MFKTEHLEGRLRYETDQVVCIDVYLKSHIAENYFITQVLLSLNNGSRAIITPDDLVIGGLHLSSTTIVKEISEGISNYIDIRKELALTPPYDTKQ